jgi:transmembrane sensor
MTMDQSGASSRNDDEWIRAEAAEWLVRRSESDHDPAREAAFHSWRLADPRHERSYRRMVMLWGAITEQQALGALEPLERPNLRKRWAAWRERRAAAAQPGRLGGLDWGGAVAAMVVMAVLAAPFLVPRLTGQPARSGLSAVTQTYETVPGEIRRIALEDGSQVTLGADSTIRVVMSGDRREVGLVSGEAYFQVAHDKRHPFYVRARGANVRVVGTEFSVSVGKATTRVSVETGIVDVSNTGLPGETVSRRGQVRLTAGDGVVAWQRDNGRPLQTVHVENVAGWRSGRLAYQGAYLADILADISRYVPEKFDLASDGIGTLRVTASFRADEAADAVPAILKGLGLSSRETRKGVLFIEWPDK